MFPYQPPPPSPLDILYQDEHLLAVVKPSGLLSVPGRGEDKQDCLLSRLREDFPEALIVHRLDMSTSGIMLLARSKAVERELSILFQQRKVHKRYIALVAGLIAQDSGEVNLPLITDWPNRPRQMVSFELGKPSCTRYQVLARDKALNTTRLELEPVTGRSHQLRVHMQALGHPILGDDLYAHPEARQMAARLLLHACAIRLPHPVLDQQIALEQDAPF